MQVWKNLKKTLEQALVWLSKFARFKKSIDVVLFAFFSDFKRMKVNLQISHKIFRFSRNTFDKPKNFWKILKHLSNFNWAQNKIDLFGLHIWEKKT